MSSFRNTLAGTFWEQALAFSFTTTRFQAFHFKTAVNQEYRDAILKGIQDGMAELFPNFPASGSIWIEKVYEHPVDSARIAFYAAARAAIEQAYSVSGDLRSDRLACP